MGVLVKPELRLNKTNTLWVCRLRIDGISTGLQSQMDFEDIEDDKMPHAVSSSGLWYLDGETKPSYFFASSEDQKLFYKLSCSFDQMSYDSWERGE